MGRIAPAAPSVAVFVPWHNPSLTCDRNITCRLIFTLAGVHLVHFTPYPAGWPLSQGRDPPLQIQIYHGSCGIRSLLSNPNTQELHSAHNFTPPVAALTQFNLPMASGSQLGVPGASSGGQHTF